MIDETTVVAPLPEDRFENAFGHIFAGGYSAGYYSYKWAEVLSADAFGRSKSRFGRRCQGRRDGPQVRDTVLAQGGAAPVDIFVEFKVEPSTEALKRHTGLAE